MLRFKEIVDVLYKRRAADDGSFSPGTVDPLLLEANALILSIRDTHRELFVESKLKVDQSELMKDAGCLEEDEKSLRDENLYLEQLIEDTSNFTFSEGARKLLEESKAATNHDGRVAQLHAEREARMQLLRELDKLQESKKSLETELHVLRSFYDSIPTKLEALIRVASKAQDNFHVPLSLQLRAFPVEQLNPMLQQLYLHFSSFAEAHPGEISSLRPMYRTNIGQLLEVDFRRKSSPSSFVLHFNVLDNVCCVHVHKGPSPVQRVNTWALSCLFPGQEGTSVNDVPTSAFVWRSYPWLRQLTSSSSSDVWSSVTIVVQMVQTLEKRVAALKQLIPQLDLLMKSSVHPLTVGGVRLQTQSTLASFTEVSSPQLLQMRLSPSIRAFVATVTAPSVAVSLTATVLIASDYPKTKPIFRLELSGKQGASDAVSASTLNLPPWTLGKVTTKLTGSLPKADAVLCGLENSLNNTRGPRDANFDISVRLAKCLLCFDLYCYSSLGLESARTSWNMSRASCIGRDRHIECEELGK